MLVKRKGYRDVGTRDKEVLAYSFARNMQKKNIVCVVGPPCVPLFFVGQKGSRWTPHSIAKRGQSRRTLVRGLHKRMRQLTARQLKEQPESKIGEQATVVHHQSMLAGTFCGGVKAFFCTLFALDHPSSFWKREPTLTLSSLAGRPWGHGKGQSGHRLQQRK